MAADNAPQLPQVGEWYLESETENEFEVIDVDPLDGIVEVQYFNGDLSELTLEEWATGKFEPIEAPEDWTGPVGKPEEGDVGYDQESFELPPTDKPLPGYEQDQVLLTEEAHSHDEAGDTEETE